MRSVPVTVPPATATVADSRGRFGSGEAYDGGQASVAGRDAATPGDVVAAAGGKTTVGAAEGNAAAIGPAVVGAVAGLDPALHAAVSAAATAATHGRQVPIGRR
jgi:hypothetical protein